MPITLPEYQNLPWYEQGLALIGDSFVEGRRLEMWVQELAYGATKPAVQTFTVDVAGAPADATQVTLTTPTDTNVYRGDVVLFDPAVTDIFVLIDEDTTITSAGTDTKIAPLIDALVGSEEGYSFGMVPVRSISEGGFLETTGTSAIARTKSMGLEPARKKVETDSVINFTGQFYVDDPGIALLTRLADGARNAYVELRYATYLTFTDDQGASFTQGSGNGAKSGEFVVNFVNYPANRTDLIQVTGNMEQASALSAYTILASATP